MEQINQHDVILVNLDPTLGKEMKKTRPCVVLSPNEMNKFLNTIIIAPITSNSRLYPTRVEITHKKTKGWIAIDQIRTIDRLRVIKIFEPLSINEIKKIKAVIKEMLVE